MSALKSVWISIWSICIALTIAECPLGYLRFHDSCYYFSTDTLDWYKAQSSCRGHNARLAEVYNRQLSDFLITEARRLGGPGYWLGGRDDIIEGDWRWSFSNKQFTFTAWAPGEPNNGIHGDQGPEDCLNLLNKLNMLWNDAPCSYTDNRFICEIPFDEGEIIGKK